MDTYGWLKYEMISGCSMLVNISIHKVKLPIKSLSLTADDGSEDLVGASDADGGMLGSCEMLGSVEGDDDGSTVGAVEGVIVRVGLLEVDGFNTNVQRTFLIMFNVSKCQYSQSKT